MKTKEQVLEFFVKHSRHKLPDDHFTLLAYRYLDTEAIDSMGIIAMITELEDKCGIRFSAEDLESYEFQSIGGLVSIIDRLRGA